MIVAADNRRSAIALLAGFLCALSLVGAGQASAAPLPAPTLTPQQPNPTKLASPSFTIQGDPAATFACKLDDEESYTTCTSPLTIGPLAEGQHTLRVLQIDSTGEPSDEAAVYSFEVDLTAPDAPGASLFIPDSAEYSVADSGFITGETSARAEFSSHDPDDVTFQCSLDGADPEDCDSPYTTGLDSLADGTHTLLITQTDEAGNVSDPATLSWTIDTEAPGDVTFDDPYASWTSATTFLADDSANISWTLPSDTGTTIRAVCSLDGGPGEDCDDSLSTSFSSLRDGPHSLKVTVVDAAGNTSPGVTISWTTDTVEPESPTVKVNRPAYTPETTATVEFSGEPHATFSCSVNGDPAVPCTSPLPLSSLDDGEQSVTVIQTDRAGNESDPATVTWTVDTVAPDAAADLESNRSGTTARRTAQLTWTDTEPDLSAFCRLYRSGSWGVWNPCSSPKDVKDLPLGETRFELKFRDRAGNESDAAQVSWTIARLAVVAPPAIDSDSATDVPLGSSISATDPEFTGSADDTSDFTVWQRCSNTVGTSCVSITGTEGNPGPGSYSPTVDDIGKRIRYFVTRTTDDGSSVSTASPMSGIVIPVVDQASGVTGLVSSYDGGDPAAAVPGFARTLTAVNATWTTGLGGRGIEYRWQRCGSTAVSCTTIVLTTTPKTAYAVQSTYVVRQSDIGRRLRVLTGVNVGSGKYVWSASALTEPVRVVAVNTAAPSFAYPTGLSAPKVRKSVSVRAGTWQYTQAGSFRYQWRVCPTDASSCTDVAKGTKSAYVPVSGDFNKKLQVRVTYRGSDGTTVTVLSGLSGAVVR